MIRRPPRSTRTDTLFPYTTLFRSTEGRAGAVLRARSNLPPGAAPIRFPEFPLEHLARILAREFGLEDNRPGNLVSGEPCAKDPLHLIGVDRHRDLGLDDGEQALAERLVGHPDDCAVEIGRASCRDRVCQYG